MPSNIERIGIYPGSFDPITNGHLDIIKRSSILFDTLIVAVLINNEKNPLFSVSDRVKMIQDVVKDIPNIKVMSFDGLLVDFAKKVGAKVAVRGLRAVSDFEYELQISQINRHLSTEMDTIFLSTDVKYAYLSSSVIKEAASYGGNIADLVPKEVLPILLEKYK